MIDLAFFQNLSLKLLLKSPAYLGCSGCVQTCADGFCMFRLFRLTASKGLGTKCTGRTDAFWLEAQSLPYAIGNLQKTALKPQTADGVLFFKFRVSFAASSVLSPVTFLDVLAILSMPPFLLVNVCCPFAFAILWSSLALRGLWDRSPWCDFQLFIVRPQFIHMCFILYWIWAKKYLYKETLKFYVCLLIWVFLCRCMAPKKAVRNQEQNRTM